jgi:Protein of unknown function (DUF1571)
MAAIEENASVPGRERGRRRRWWLALLAIPAALMLASWWLTEPLADRVAPGATSGRPPVPVSADVKSAAADATAKAGEGDPTHPVWPEGKLDGPRAKALLLDVLLVAAERLNQIDDYTATFRKQERLNGKLGPVQTLQMKVRHKPFAIYFKFLNPQAGREVVYAEGHHDNKLIAHATGVSRLLIPRLAVPPDSKLALLDSRHPVTEAGLANLTAKLIGFRRMDLEDTDAVTVLDRFKDEDGREWLRSVHTHTHRIEHRPFARVEVLYDPTTFFPMDIHSYDWPEAGQTGDLHLAEHYHYQALDTNASLSALDFDPANPEYAFQRY